MQVSVETTQGLERRLTITVPAESIDSQVKSRLQQLAKTQRINGFRPGKVPVSVIKKRYGQAVRQEIAGEAMQRNFYEAIVQEKITPAGMPNFEMKTDVDGQDLEFVAAFEVYPEVEVKDVEKIEVEKPVVEITDADLETMMETLRKQHATWKEVKRKCKKDDRVTVDFVGTIDGEEFEGGKAENFELEMGKDRMIPGFEKPIVGAKAGDEVVADVTFPEDYHAEALKGKEAQFKITVNKVEGLNLPKVDEEFAKLFGVEDGDVEALNTEVRKNMQRELEQTLKANVKEQVIEGLLANNELELPKALVDQEINALREQAKQRFSQQQGGNVDNLPELPADLFQENARKRVSIGLLLGEVIKTEELKVDSAKVDALIETAASAYEDPQEVIEYYKTNDELMQQMQNVALEEQAVEVLLSKANVKEVTKAFDEIMNKQA
ncbi:MAG: trigger factor [Alteromonadaceae bacterium]|jgi:trigger factor|uniref:Trigger factor n=1 Tax=Paraglaciecola chathamensis TaxID=368405 RepID=A0ABS0WAF1_9ALTE|nr:MULTISPECIES: trigger factor [Paraglaciecola]MBJ2135337.1 trigger factor [Paraglaciecola chathamensis]MBN28082.1 trigger factor [Alteromonadaceae bacterium]MBU3019443.1 trigger factor [Paraglaciecola agarilytica]MDO6558127.1 trigger factor [Paraglaciecola chathamensis]|tara:strand:+ start:3123 stop:4433 length:1311 start_codon:yes stop_codon:yes gene_type:complete